MFFKQAKKSEIRLEYRNWMLFRLRASHQDKDPQAYRLAGVRGYEDRIVCILAIYLFSASRVLLDACSLNDKGEWLGSHKSRFRTVAHGQRLVEGLLEP